MRTFEYLVVHVDHGRAVRANHHWLGEVDEGAKGDRASCPELVDYLADAGAQGWELVAVDPEQTDTAVLYFKRSWQR